MASDPAGVTVAPLTGLQKRLVRWAGSPGTLETSEATVIRHDVAVGETVLISEDASVLPAPGVDEAGTRLVVDQSAAQLAFRVSGAKARALIAKGTAVDLHDSAFAVGATVGTRFGAFRVLLVRSASDVFDLHIDRSFGDALMDLLLDYGAEFGVREG
ncbi:MAG: sarcosine oxidase subunit gamma family protein [Thalassobaculaceae bacterium]|nr:sarcosine oxidase subunit gamma family protein [Thalassobaculaceae bacterium]